MRITINTKDAGPLTFFAPDAGGYVYLESGARRGTLGTQICSGGTTRGNTLRCGPSVESLARVARDWNHTRRANLRREYA